MDKEDRERLIRIDESTSQIAAALSKHMKEDREDFKELHSRVNKGTAKTNWIIGIGTGAGIVVGTITAFFKSGGSG